MSDDAVQLHHLYDYDRETGEWLLRNYAEGGKGRRRAIGDPVGTVDKRDGTRVIRFQGKMQRASRLSWLYEYGEWPSRQVVYEDPDLPLPARDRISNLKLAGEREELTADLLRRLVTYDPEAGDKEFTWRFARKGVKAGDPVGGSRGAQGQPGHKYIRINGIDYAAQRVAWLYIYGEWPKSRIVFRDGDPMNIRIKNLIEGHFEHGTRQNPVLTEEDRRRRQAETYRRSDLKKIGWTDEAWVEAFDRQSGLCAICQRPETAAPNHGRGVKRLSGDHDHVTGERRELLCGKCNTLIGMTRDDDDSPERIDILEAAIAYLRRHAAKDEAA